MLPQTRQRLLAWVPPMAALTAPHASEEPEKRCERYVVSETTINGTTQEAHDDDRGSSQYF